jgi:uncharacterized membrane protein YeiH
VNILVIFDYAGVALFAATGALTASRKELDVIGFLFLAVVTGIGGGTARDLILGVPVFWLEQHIHVVVCAGTAIFVYFTADLIENRYRLLLWLDALALSAYGVFGAYKGLVLTGSPVVALVTGAMTGTFGGMLRDVLAGEPTALTRKEIYITAAVIGAAAFVLAQAAGLPRVLAAALGFTLAFAVRGGALAFGWSLPAYRSRPGRPPDRGPRS